MKVIILAAGRGSRLRPLTDTCPKPLLTVAGKPLIVYHLENLQRAGFRDIIINLFHLGDQLESYLGKGEKWGVNISYSKEPYLLEVGGGIFHALPLLGDSPFLVVNGDIWTDFPFIRLKGALRNFPSALAHLVLVDNPAHHPQGDFQLNSGGRLTQRSLSHSLTYSGIAILSPQLFAECLKGEAFRLLPLLEKAMGYQQLTGEHYTGEWVDVGTLERLEFLERKVNPSPSRNTD